MQNHASKKLGIRLPLTMQLLSKLILISAFVGWTICFNSPIMAQTYISTMQSFGEKDGLAEGNPNTIMKDSKGMIWITSDYGLFRFDGHYFKHFTQKTNNLSTSRIYSLAEDDRQMLWLLHKIDDYNANHITIFDPSKETTLSITDYLSAPLPFPVEQIITLTSSPIYGIIILLKEGKVYHYQAQKFKQLASIPDNYAWLQFHTNSDSSFWLSHPKKMLRIHPNQQVLDSIIFPSNFWFEDFLGVTPDFEPMYIGKFLPEVEKEYIFMGNRQIAILPTRYNEVIAIDLVNERLYFIHKREAKHLFIGDLEGNILEKVTTTHLLESDDFIYFDKELWFAAWTKGIGLVKTTPTYFNTYLKDFKTVYDGYPYGARGMHLLDTATLLVNGLEFSYRVNLKTGKTTQFGVDLPFYPTFKGIFKSIHTSLAIMEDHEGKIWITDELFRLLQYDPIQQTFTNYTYSEQEHKRYMQFTQRYPDYPPFVQWGLYEDRAHRIWIGHNNGLSYLDRKKGYIQRFHHAGEFETLGSSTVYHFHENEEGVWLATTTGLYLFDPLGNNGKGVVKQHFHKDGEGDQRFPYNHIAHIYEDTLGTFWIASKGGGLIKWHPKTRELSQFTTKQGLSHNVIYAVYEDDYQQLWLSSNKGIMRFHKLTHESTVYLPKDGTSHSEFNTISHLQTPDGTIYFGSLNGITSFHPKDFALKNKLKYPIQVVDLQVQSSQSGAFSNALVSFHQEKAITLAPSDLGFVLHFTSPNFKPTQIKYAYKLEHIDKDWIYLTEPSIRLNSLPYGQHSLLIRTQGELGIWESPMRIPIIKERPFYLQITFIIAAILFLILSIFLFLHYRSLRHQAEQKRLSAIITERTAVISKQAEDLQRLDQLKSKFFANISHELRTPLTLMLLPISELLSQSRNEAEERLLQLAQTNGKSLQTMINSLLDLSKLEAKKLTLDTTETNYSQYLHQLFSSFHSLAHYQEIDYQYDISIQSGTYLLMDQEKVQRILINLISNAFKFSPENSTIQLYAWQEKDTQKIQVKDTGYGISPMDLPYIFERYYQSKKTDSPAMGGSGIGLALAKEFALLMQGTIEVESELDKGSTFTFSFPNKIVNPTPLSTHRPPTSSPTLAPAINTTKEKKKQATILVVEDHQDLQELLHTLLKEEYHILKAKNGEVALYLLQKLEHKELPSLIISDLMMPKMDGYSLLRHIKAHQTWCTIPTIVLTARASDSAKLQALRIGIDDYMIKPFSSLELKTRIANLIKNARLRQATVNHSPIVSSLENNIIEKENATISKEDLAWLSQVEKAIQLHISKKDFSLEDIAQKQQLSMRQFQRKLKKITGITPVQYQKEIQLHTAKKHLENNSYQQLSEVAHAVGFQTTKYFTKLYLSKFGKHPNEYFKGE